MVQREARTDTVPVPGNRPGKAEHGERTVPVPPSSLGALTILLIVLLILAAAQAGRGTHPRA